MARNTSNKKAASSSNKDRKGDTGRTSNQPQAGFGWKQGNK